MRAMVSLGAVLAGMALVGCAEGPRAQVAQQAQTALVGMPKSRLLSCAGVPARQAAADGREYYTYVHGSGYGYGGPSTSIGVGGGSSSGVGVGLGLGFPLFGGGSSGYCEATFVLQNGVVQQVNYPAGSYLPDCGSIVQNCMAP